MRTCSAVILAAACLAPVAPSQTCPDQGSNLLAATIEPGPDLGCAAAPGWPYWHLLTPAHRAVVPRPGMQQGDAHAVPRVLVHWRCTGFLLLPVVPDRVRTMGFVLDVAELPCAPAASDP